MEKLTKETLTKLVFEFISTDLTRLTDPKSYDLFKKDYKITKKQFTDIINTYQVGKKKATTKQPKIDKTEKVQLKQNSNPTIIAYKNQVLEAIDRTKQLWGDKLTPAQKNYIEVLEYNYNNAYKMKLN